MAGLLFKSMLLAALCGGWGSVAAGYPAPAARNPEPAVPSATALSDMEPTLPPLAFMQFCAANREQCAGADAPRPIWLDARSWADLTKVNREVNDAIAPDPSKGSSDWSLVARSGNCNDYAVQKRDALIKLGYPVAALSLAMVQTAFGEGHLVLTVRTNRGDFVLDNRRAPIVAWNRTGYRWFKRQSFENPQYWVAVSPRPALPDNRFAIQMAAAGSHGEKAAQGMDQQRDLPETALAQPISEAELGFARMAAGFGMTLSPTSAAQPFPASTDVLAQFAPAGTRLARLALDGELSWAAWPMPASDRVAPTS